MFCRACGVALNNDDKFCSNCGKPVLTDEELKDKKLYTFVGKNAYYYKGWWELTSRPGSKICWNWVAFFLTPYWLGYRKMYRWLFAYQGIMLVLTLIGYLMSFSKGADTWNLIDGLATSALLILAALFGNALYYRFAQKKISETVLEQESDDLLIELGHKGGISAAGVWLAIGLEVVNIGIRAFLIGP